MAAQSQQQTLTSQDSISAPSNTAASMGGESSHDTPTTTPPGNQQPVSQQPGAQHAGQSNTQRNLETQNSTSGIKSWATIDRTLTHASLILGGIVLAFSYNKFAQYQHNQTVAATTRWRECIDLAVSASRSTYVDNFIG